MTTFFTAFPNPAAFRAPVGMLTPRKFVLGGAARGAFPLPTDPIGQINLSFSGVKPGSEIQIFDTSRNRLAGSDSVGAAPSFTLNTYAVGSASNNVRILVIALGYEVIDIAFTLPPTSTTIPVFQRIDRTYRNPPNDTGGSGGSTIVTPDDPPPTVPIDPGNSAS